MRHVKTEHTRGVISVLQYFDYFDYAATLKELHAYFPHKIKMVELEQVVRYMAKNRNIDARKHKDEEYYTIQGHSINHTRRIRRKTITKAKIAKVTTFVKIASFFSQIQLIGISGSCAMDNANQNDDVDFFIITACNKLWTGRFIALMIAQMLGIRRRKAQTKVRDRVCLNLFFDESDLVVPKYKRNIYTAHEVVQMRPLFIRGRAYEHFMSANKWVKAYFPNMAIKTTNTHLCHKGKIDFIERLLKLIQLSIMKRNITTEIITDKQLWFFPDDFQMRLYRKDRKIFSHSGKA